MEINDIKRDVAKVEAGTWIDDIPGMGKLRLRVRGMSNKMFTTLRSRKQRALEAKDKERDGQPKPEAARRILGECLVETILLEWDGVTINGVATPYSKELAAKWLVDPEMEDFSDAVVWAATVADREATGVKEAVEKNSKRSSGGSSSSESQPTS